MAKKKFFGSSYRKFCSDRQVAIIDSISSNEFEKFHSVKSFFATDGRYQKKDFLSHVNYGHEAYDYLFNLDLMVRCAGVCQAFFIELLVDRSGKLNENISLIRSMASLSGYTSQLGLCAERLILQGDDLAARILARSVSEASDYSVAFQHDLELAKKYSSSAGNFKEIWYRYLRSDKARKSRDSALKSLFEFDSDAIYSLNEFRDCELDALSQAAHPSYDAGIMFLFQDRSFSSDGGDEAWVSGWPHARVCTFLIDCIALQMVTSIVPIVNGTPFEFEVKTLKNSYFHFDQESLSAVLKFSILASNFNYESGVERMKTLNQSL